MASAENSGDRVLRETRWASVIIVAVLLPALVILWGLPTETKTLWAWTIKPAMTPIFMGASYGAGAYFFMRLALSRRWHVASAGVLSAAIFAAFMLVVTLVHFNKFNHGHAPFLAAVAFYGWTSVYIVSPFAVAWLWLRNQRTDARRLEPGDQSVPPLVRYIARAVSAGAIALGIIFLLSPPTANDVWAWKLTPLTAGVIGSFMIQVGVGSLLLALDERWSSWRLLLETFLIATALMLVGAIREWSKLDHSNASTWIFVAGLAASALAILLLFRAMEAKPVPGAAL
ncbi:MAG: hypothetical protein M3071_11285 [Actinomycetota bacterium]|nr:hypothetical protein [Actinomycetota bacterium]